MPVAATNEQSAEEICKRHDAARLGETRGASAPGAANGPLSASCRSWAAHPKPLVRRCVQTFVLFHFSKTARNVHGMYKRRRPAPDGRRFRAEVVGSAAWARSSCDKRMARIVAEVASTRSGVEPRLHNVLGVSCTAGSECRSRSGAAVAANDVRSTEWR